MRGWALSGGALAAIVAGSCVDLTAYRCQTDEDCEAGGRLGICEPVNYCSYPDAGCESGRRFSDLAGSLSRECTEAEVPQGDTVAGTGGVTTDGGDTGATEDDGSGPSTDGSSVDGVDAVCGDGVTEGAEECDDDNDQDGDGCNVDCTLSGAILWIDVLGEADSDQEFWGVTTLPGSPESVAVVGRSRDTVARTLVYDLESRTEVWAVEQNSSASDTARAVAVHDGLIYAGVSTNEGGGLRAGPDCFEPEMGEGCGRGRATNASLRDARALAVIPRDEGPNLLVSAGSSGTAGVAEFDSTALDMPVWQAVIPDANEVLGVAVMGDDRIAAATVDDRMWLGTVNDGEPMALWVDADRRWPESAPQALIAVDGFLIAGGYSESDERRPLVVRVSSEGELDRSFHDADVFKGDIDAITLHAAGQVLAVGYRQLTPGGPSILLIIKLTPDVADLVWAREYPDVAQDEAIARGVTAVSNDELVVVGETKLFGHSDGFIARVSI